MKNKLFAIAFTMVALIVIFSYSCNRDKGICRSCKIAEPNIVATFRFGDLERDFNLWQKMDDKDRYVYGTNNEHISQKEISIVLSQLGIRPLQQDSIVSLVIYTNTQPSANTDLNTVKGCLLYSLKDGIIQAAVYRKHGTVYQKMDQLTSSSGQIFLLEIKLVSYILNNKEKESYAIALNNNDISYTYRAGIKNEFRHKLYKELGYWQTMEAKTSLAKPIYDQHDSDPQKCGLPCASYPNLTCVPTPAGMSHQCVKDDYYEDQKCSEKEAASMAHFDNSQNETKIHYFRDNLLVKSLFGQHIINDFYYCSNILSGKLSYAQALNAIGVINDKVVPVLEKLNSPDAASSNAILVSNQDADDIIVFVNSMKELSGDAMYQEILQETISNINYFRNKTVASAYGDIALD